MCGIVGVLGLRNASQLVREGLERLEYRGYDSAGLAWIDEAGIEVAKEVGTVSRLPEIPARGETMAIGHTRWATHGGVTQLNAHPHLDGTGRFAVVHNGTIEGHHRLRSALEAQGHRFVSETDTEVLAHLYERSRRQLDPLPALQEVLAGVEGSWALLVMDSEADVITFARHRTPLVLGLADGATLLASDLTALLAHTRKIVFLDDGDHGIVTRDGVQLFDGDGKPKVLEPQLIDWDLSQAEKAGYDHFMLKEIHESPVALNQCLAGRLLQEPARAETHLDPSTWDNVDRVRLVACGTSYHASLMGREFLERWAGIPAEAVVASELRDRPAIGRNGTLFIGVSQSGETLDTLEALRPLHARGDPLLAITNVQGSSLQRLADESLQTRVGPEVGVAATKTLLGQATTLAVVALEQARRREHLADEELRALVSDLRRMPRTVETVLGMEERLARLGRKLARHRSLFFLGRGIHVATACEAALKFKEITYQHAEGFGAGELKHGPFALLDHETPCIFFLSKGPHYERTLGAIFEVKARGAPVHVFTQGPLEDLENVADTAIAIPETDPLLACIPFSVAGQLVSYHAAVALGREVDRPRNLAKSVTVE
ncbi:MAG: glutamine--fructose-6-phosphate transaminase (isomerizing) [Thermoplasmatota archaeon]